MISPRKKVGLNKVARKGGLLFLVCLVAMGVGCRKRGIEMRFGGGPAGATFQRAAEGIAETISEAIPEVRITVERSGGSLANLLMVENGKLDMALVHAGDAYLGQKGLLSEDLPPVNNVRALARVYGSIAQLVVRREGIIQTPFDLRHRRVAIGSSGSGAAQSAKRYFSILGIWDEVIPIYVGYSMAMAELGKGGVDAVWELVGAPSASLQEASLKIPLRLIDLQEAGDVAGLFEKYPFYLPAVIPKGTYYGQEHEVNSFQDSTLWVAGAKVDKDFVFVALSLLFSEKGLAEVHKKHPVLVNLSLDQGIKGVEIQFHRGAQKFWESRGRSQSFQR